MGGSLVLQERIVRVHVKEFDEAFLDEVERYRAWMDLASELAGREAPWILKLN